MILHDATKPVAATATTEGAIRDSSAGRVPKHTNLRKAGWVGIAAAATALALLVSQPPPVLSQAVQLVVVNIEAVANGYRTSKLIGTDVLNDKNDAIGTIDDIIISRDRVLFAVLQIGGFLGLGGHLVAVPYESLVLEDSGKKIVLPGATKDELKKLQEFEYRS